MTTWNYVGLAWIIWTMFNEGLAMMMTSYLRKPSVVSGVLSWIASGIALWLLLA